MMEYSPEFEQWWEDVYADKLVEPSMTSALCEAFKRLAYSGWEAGEKQERELA